MQDSELIELFRGAKLPHKDWTHRAHLRVALYYLKEMTAAEALAELRERIQHLNLFHGVYTTPERGYHETRTRVWLAVLSEALTKNDDTDLVEEYARRDVALDYYHRETLNSWESRIGWVPPDKKSLPVDPGPWCPQTPQLFTFPE